jgi:hypothetical protein
VPGRIRAGPAAMEHHFEATKATCNWNRDSEFTTADKNVKEEHESVLISTNSPISTYSRAVQRHESSTFDQRRLENIGVTAIDRCLLHRHNAPSIHLFFVGDLQLSRKRLRAKYAVSSAGC